MLSVKRVSKGVTPNVSDLRQTCSSLYRLHEASMHLTGNNDIAQGFKAY